MKNEKDCSLTSIIKIKNFKDFQTSLINEHLNLGWKLLNINNVIDEGRNLETGDYEQLPVTLFTLGWSSDSGEILTPDEKEESALESFEETLERQNSPF